MQNKGAAIWKEMVLSQKLGWHCLALIKLVTSHNNATVALVWEAVI